VAPIVVSGDGGVAADASTPVPIPAPKLIACPTTTASAMYDLPFSVPGASCFNFTPVDTGEPASGENATLPHYAIRPSAPGAKLVLFLVGSGGHPSGPLQAGPTTNLYAAAIADGNAVFGVSYKNAESIGDICKSVDSCFFPTRESLLLGTPETGAGLTATIDESVVDRTARALRYLDAGDPAGGWGAFLTSLDPTVPAAQALNWPMIITVGHSQGGGHAAALGKLFPVAKVVQLSSTCDNSDGVAASWTDGTSGTWASNPATFYGFAAPSTLDPIFGTFSGDSTCPYHTENWTHLGMRGGVYRNNNAEICGDTGDTHSESLKCPDNFPTWVSLLK
jgi:hypothetical protein